LSAPPARNFTRLAVSIIIAAVLVSASALSYSSFEATTTRTVTTTTAATSTLVSTSTSTATTTVNTTSGTTCLSTSNTTNSFTTDCQLGVTLGLATSPAFPTGHNLTFSVSLTNDLAKSDDVYESGCAECLVSDYTLPVIWPCGGVFNIGPPSLPVVLMIDNGSGTPLQLSDTNLQTFPDCIAVPGQGYYILGPSQTLTETLSVSGYWTSPDANEPWINSTHSQFSPGNYTVIAFDEWGQLAPTLNFVVS
jgi:hypothetical protein